MRIIFLNCWYGKAGKVFLDFLSNNSENTDAFCFSEVHLELFEKLQSLLKEFDGYFETDNKKEILGYIYGQASFVKKSSKLKVISSGKLDTYRNVKNDTGFTQYLNFNLEDKKLFLCNVHGKCRPGTKLDTPARLRQSKKIIGIANESQTKLVIVGGDFNLMPNTRSIKMFENAGYRNLIKEFDIKETRNRLSWEQFPNNEKQHFADYVFTSSKIKVKDFEVPNIDVSDHLPLILDFEI